MQTCCSRSELGRTELLAWVDQESGKPRRILRSVASRKDVTRIPVRLRLRIYVTANSSVSSLLASAIARP